MRVVQECRELLHTSYSSLSFTMITATPAALAALITVIALSEVCALWKISQCEHQTHRGKLRFLASKPAWYTSLDLERKCCNAPDDSGTLKSNPHRSSIAIVWKLLIGL
eukprot:1666396-Amphidinium_carterae.1